MTPATSLIGILDRSFIDLDAGKPWHYVGMTASALFKRWLMDHGPDALVKPNLDAWRAMADEGGYTGDIVLRVFRTAQPPNSFALDPWDYDMRSVAEFTAFCNSFGFRIDWTAGDAQSWSPLGNHGRQEHTNQFCNALAGITPTNFVQALNEPFKNGGLIGFDLPPSRVIVPTSPWGTYLRDSGQYYEGAWDVRTNLDFISLHPSRASEGTMFGVVDKWVGKPYESAVYLWPMGIPLVQNEMMGFDEVASGARSNRPGYAMRMGLAVAFSGVAFHSSAGHPCDAFGPVTRRCAVAFFRGAAAGIKAMEIDA